jgi:polyvinyl alcohol dehydrogenase (cytochrome)
VFYSLDAETGCTAGCPGRGARRRASRRGTGNNLKHVVYVGDLKANVYAIDAATGALLWKKQTDTSIRAVTGSVKLHEGKRTCRCHIEAVAQPTYECCTFRGAWSRSTPRPASIVEDVMISETPAPVGKNSKGTTLYGPAGVAVWNSRPSIREGGPMSARVLHTEPAVLTSDSVMAMDLKTGRCCGSAS